MENFSDIHAILPPRRRTHPVRIGSVLIGGDNPVAVQTMTNVSTLDTKACLAQIASVRVAGGRIVRLTAQGPREAENLAVIASRAREAGMGDVALVADIHFRADVALIAAEHVDKVRINPGNYRDPDGEELRRLIEVCRRRGVAIRIGVNHGSLAPAILDRYGDTPEGMVASAMEFLAVCRAEGFDQVVVSMKSSNVRVMVAAYRLLAARMDAEGMTYPLHLGVTEAGDGMQGRIKSSVGIGTLLAEGLGDTIRVSLTEPPENEIPVGMKLAGYFRRPAGGKPGKYNPEPRAEEFSRRESTPVGNLGGGRSPLLYRELDTVALAGIGTGEVYEAERSGDFPSAWAWERRIKRDAGARPVILSGVYNELTEEDICIKAAADFGPVMLDGLADGMRLENVPPMDNDTLERIALAIMQAARVRISHTEYIACPGCGRTLYDLQKTLADIRSRTEHLVGLKIGVMGCIVNGPGEMADADYGYVGEGAGKVSLYKGRQLVERGVAQERAVEALIDIIRRHGHWKEPR